ncbi:unnamed protein product, partial [Adineta steineri]
VSYLGGTVLQWFVNLTLQNQQPSSWADFKEKITSQFQPADFQEHLREQLFQLRQKQSVDDYIQSFGSILDQVHYMDVITQIMFFVHDLSSNTEAIREAITYESFTTSGKNNHVKYNPFLETSSTVELNLLNTRSPRRQHRYTTPFNSTTTKEDCFKYGLCFYCKESGHLAFNCPKKKQQPYSSSATSHQKNDQCSNVQDVNLSSSPESIVKVDLVNDHEEFNEIMSLVKTKESDKSALIFVEGKVNDYHVHILIDCGASHYFIADDFIKKHHIPTNSIPSVSVAVARGFKSHINQTLMNFNLQLGDFNDNIPSAYVFPMQSDTAYDLILGLPWLFKNIPHIDWKTRMPTTTHTYIFDLIKRAF